ncbi:MAG: magnesium chelatase subunit D family protein [Desulfobaccales bacterium]
MTPKRPVYPFAALVGQEILKKALILNAINPRLGGVLVRGEKGTAKSTAARGLAALLPPIPMVANCPFHCHPEQPELMCDNCRERFAQGQGLPVRYRPMPVVDLPLGTTEDRLLGSIDLEKAIKSGEKHFEPGLLAAANRGILYVDEVNLLDDHLVDVLLDAAAMGVNVVEREGISFEHPARFILVGTMNPEEGELRPQLLDRFGMCVEVAGLPNIDDRMAVVTRRLAYEENPEKFAARWEADQDRLREAIISARERLPQVTYTPQILRLISMICLDQGVDGHRADIYMLKAAQTLAAYHGRDEVSPEDVREAALLVLPHRRRRQPFGDTRLDQDKLEESFKKFQEEQEAAYMPPGPPPTADSAPLSEGKAWRGEVVAPPDDPFAVAPLDLPPSRQVRNAPGSRTRTRSDNQTGRYVRATPTPPPTPDLALDATLRAAAPYQVKRDKGNLALAIAEPDLRHKVRERKIGRHILLVVDASGSMGAQERMRETKAAILSLLLDAYQRRERVGLVVFQGNTATPVLPFTHSIEVAQRYLRDLPTGGKTPLPHGLALALNLIKKERAKYPKDAFLLVLITDGKANVSLTGKVAMDEVKELAVQVKTLGINSLILNTERYWHEASCLPEISRMMGASYYTIDKLKARDLVTHISTALK